MKHYWINKDNSSSVILFFLGWGADHRCLARMDKPSCDVVAFYDYDNLDTDVDLSPYNEIKIVAWSMGVFNAQCFISQRGIRPSHTTAIAGTCDPVDAQHGLIPEICQGTLDNWADATRRKFSMRMCGGRQGFVDLMPLMSDRTVDNQKNELALIMQRAVDMAEDICHNDNIRWDKAIISTADLIFLPDNQRRYWQTHANEIVETEMPHFPFGTISTWNILA